MKRPLIAAVALSAALCTAAFAQTQFHVSKQERGGRTLSSVTRLDDTSRVEELARMLAGSVTDASLRAAAELLEAAAASATQPTS